MTTLLVLVVLIALVLGPGRPFIFQNLRFFVPGVLGAKVGFWWVLMWTPFTTRPAALPAWLPLIGAVFGFFAFGKFGKQWMDKTFGPRQ